MCTTVFFVWLPWEQIYVNKNFQDTVKHSRIKNVERPFSPKKTPYHVFFVHFLILFEVVNLLRKKSENKAGSLFATTRSLFRKSLFSTILFCSIIMQNTLIIYIDFFLEKYILLNGTGNLWLVTVFIRSILKVFLISTKIMN